MRYSLIIALFVVAAGVFAAGCAQPAASRADAPAALVTPSPAPVASSLPAVTETPAPAQVVTVVHQVSLLKDIRDRDLLFTLQVPVEWNPSTTLLKNADDSEGLIYRTDLVPGDVFYILTYTDSRNQDQGYRDQFRKWTPAPAETTVTSGGVTWDRFESSSNGKTQVAYVARKGSANERGYASVLVFTADDSDRFQKDDFEKVVASFSYFSAHAADTVPGSDIPRNG